MSTALTTYAHDISELHQKAQEHAATAIQCAMEAGQLLIDAKANVKHGGWLPFVESTGINERTARNYMHLARNQDLLKSATVADMGVKKALEYLAGPQRKPPAIGEYLYSNLNGVETWIWPYSLNYFHRVKVTHAKNEEDATVMSALHKPVSWRAMAMKIHGNMKLRTDEIHPEGTYPFVAGIYRESTTGLNSGDNYNPLEPLDYPHVEVLEYLAEPKVEMPDQGTAILDRIRDAGVMLVKEFVSECGGPQKAAYKLATYQRRKRMTNKEFDSWCEENDIPSIHDLRSMIALEETE